MKQSKMLRSLKRISRLVGLILVAVSIYFSWDGLDQTVVGGNPNYTEVASVIGLVLASVCSLLQFIFNTDYANLNPTLKTLGFASYAYSIYTNKLGISHLLGFNEMTSWMVAVGMDALPEALIAWSLDEFEGDFVGNMIKMVMGDDEDEKPRQKFNNQNNQQRSEPRFEPKPSFEEIRKKLANQQKNTQPFLHKVGGDNNESRKN